MYPDPDPITVGRQPRAARYTFLTLKHTLSSCLVLLACLDVRGYLGEEYHCVPRRVNDGPCFWPHLQQTSQSRREG